MAFLTCTVSVSLCYLGAGDLHCTFFSNFLYPFVSLTDSHRLNFYFSTIWSPKESTPPHTQIIAFLDDVPIIKYPNNNRKLQRLADWLENVHPKHWEALEESAKYYEQRHQYKIQRLRLPQSKQKCHPTSMLYFLSYNDTNTFTSFCSEEQNL